MWEWNERFATCVSDVLHRHVFWGNFANSIGYLQWVFCIYTDFILCGNVIFFLFDSDNVWRYAVWRYVFTIPYTSNAHISAHAYSFNAITNWDNIISNSHISVIHVSIEKKENKNVEKKLFVNKHFFQFPFPRRTNLKRRFVEYIVRSTMTAFLLLLLFLYVWITVWFYHWLLFHIETLKCHS